MDYISTSQAAEKWKVSRRLVSRYCSEGRIQGAILVGKCWMVPERSEKPSDPRKKVGE